MTRLLLLLPLFLTQVATAQSIAPKRLIAHSYYMEQNGVLSLIDSARYAYYDSSRGSRFDYNELRYPDILAFGQNAGADFLSLTPANNIDSSYGLLVAFDTAVYYDRTLNGFHGEGRHYAPGTRLDRVNNVVYDGAGSITYASRLIHAYAGGLPSRSYTLTYSTPGVYDTTAIRYYTYDAAGRVLTDSVMLWLSPGVYHPYARTTYTYGAGKGYLTQTGEDYVGSTSAYRKISTLTASYYPNGAVRSMYLEGVDLSTGNAVPQYRDSFGYTPGVAGFTYRYLTSYNTSGGPSTDYETRTNRINAFGKKDSVTEISYYNGGVVGGNAIRIIYDAAGDPVQRNFSLRDPNGDYSVYTSEHYYYNKAFNVGLESVAAATPSITLSPNPTTGRITLHHAGVAGMLSVLITNAGGQTVYSERLMPQGNATDIWLGADVPAGFYAVSVTDAGGQMAYRGTVVKE